MKKILALTMALILVLSLAACGAKDTTPETTAAATAAATEEAVETEAARPHFDKLTLEFVPSKDADVIIAGTENLPELVKAEMADEVAVRVEDAGVFVVPKPLNRALLFGAVKLAQAANRRIMGLQRQNNILQQKIDDIRLVDRAKCALIQYRLLTEPEAHRYIEREAMDSRRTRREVAQAILRMYEGGC